MSVDRYIHTSLEFHAADDDKAQMFPPSALVLVAMFGWVVFVMLWVIFKHPN